MDLSLSRPARTAARGVRRARGPHRAATDVRHIHHRAPARNHHQPGVFPLQASTHKMGLDQIRYASHHAAKLAIGSGATESTCWQMQQRVKLPGQSWEVGLRGVLATLPPQVETTSSRCS